jgi:hypothetical protein
MGYLCSKFGGSLPQEQGPIEYWYEIMDYLTAVELGTNIVNIASYISYIFNGLLEYCHCVNRDPAKSKEIREELLVPLDTALYGIVTINVLDSYP